MDVLYIPQLDDVAPGKGRPVRYRFVRREPVAGAVSLEDRAVTRVEIGSGDPVRFVLPPAAPGEARDLIVRIVVSTDDRPELSFVAAAGEKVSFEGDGAGPFRPDASAVVLSFTEVEEGVFFACRRSSSLRVGVSFDACGGLLSKTDAEFAVGSVYGKLPVPLALGKTFAGWRTQTGEPVAEGDRCRADVTRLYAEWTDVPDPFGAAICQTGNLAFRTSGHAPWAVDGSFGRTGGSSARSGSVSDGQSSSLFSAVSGPGYLTFMVKTSCENFYDRFQLFIDGNHATESSGEGDWVKVNWIVSGEGVHDIEWRFVKDDSVSGGQDCCWLDDVTWTPDGGR